MVRESGIFVRGENETFVAREIGFFVPGANATFVGRESRTFVAGVRRTVAVGSIETLTREGNETSDEKSKKKFSFHVEVLSVGSTGESCENYVYAFSQTLARLYIASDSLNYV